jgi:IclR family pca regulon transcriptional regulator
MGRLQKADAEKRANRGLGPDFSEGLARGLTVIRAFSDERRQMTLSDLSRLIDLPRATVRRALLTLTHLGYLEADGRLFRLTPRILTLATAYLRSNTVSMVLQPTCERICQHVNESCSTTVLDGEDVVMIARAIPSRLISIGIGVGYRIPAFCGALGRVLLAALPDRKLDEFLSQLQPVRITPYTIVNKRAVRAAIIKARTDNYSYVDQEAEAGFRSVAVPLKRYDGVTIAAMNIGAPVERVTKDTMLRTFLPILRRESEELMSQLI